MFCQVMIPAASVMPGHTLITNASFAVRTVRGVAPAVHSWHYTLHYTFLCNTDKLYVLHKGTYLATPGLNTVVGMYYG